jgi:polyhydroxyalkanoate synthesis repressor PhaR
MQFSQAKTEPVIVKKYANRRLYDTGTSAYITLEDLCLRVKEGKDFIVLDAKTNQDLTNQVLTQIILEQEIKGAHLLPTNFLRSAIRFYDDKMVGVLQPYLEASMSSFNSNQERMKQMMGKAMGEFSPISQFEEMSRQNAALFEKTMQMFNPFGTMFGNQSQPQPEQAEEEMPVKARRSKRG